MLNLDKRSVLDLLRKADGWEVGHEESYRDRLTYDWTFTIRREEEKYAPFKYELKGVCDEVSIVGTHQTWSHRYCTIDDLLLHIKNRLNQNGAISNRYLSIEEYLLGNN